MPKTNEIRIRQSRSNFEFRFDYNGRLINFIKNLPREHWFVKPHNFLSNGENKTEWVWSVRPAQVSNVINFLVDNSLSIKFENVPEREIDKLRFEFIDRRRRMEEALKLKEVALDVDFDDYSWMKIQPYEYQKKAIKFFEINNGVAILGDQPGVGKTCPAFAYAIKHNLKTLIVCPSSLKLKWRDEIHQFTNAKAYAMNYKPKKKNLKAGEIYYPKEDCLIHIVSYGSLKTYIKPQYMHTCSGDKLQKDGSRKKCGWKLVDAKKKHKECPNCFNTDKIRSIKYKEMEWGEDSLGETLNPQEYDLIVLDECQRIKNKEAQQTKIIKSQFAQVPKKLLLSGTVVKNKPYEFFEILNFLNPHEWNDAHYFGLRYGGGYQSKYGWDYDGASNIDELYFRIAPFFLRRLKRDVLTELPDKTYSDIYIELTGEERRRYNKLKKGILELVESGEEITLESQMAIMHKMREHLSHVKAKRTKEIAQTIIDGGHKVVTMSMYVSTAKMINETFSKSVLFTGKQTESEKYEAVNAFQERKDVDLFSGTIMAAGVGLTLTSASEEIVVDFPWTYSDLEQAEDRIHRASSTADKIHITRLICKDTIDEDIKSMVDLKEKITKKVMGDAPTKKQVVQYLLTNLKK